MVVASSYANEARRQVGQFLVEQTGYSKKTEINFYKQGNDILTRVYLQKSREITQVHVGIVPLYIPDSLHVMYAANLTAELPISILREDDNAQQARAWTEGVIKCLNGGILSLMESISSPQPLLDYLNNRSKIDRRFVMPPIEKDQLIIFSLAYLGDVSSAIDYAKAAQQKIQKERIDNLAYKVAQWDEELAKIRGSIAKNVESNRKYLEEQISAHEREKRLAILDAEQNAPKTIQMYGKWIEPFVVAGFNSEEYFAQIIEHNKVCLKYDRLFSSNRQKRR